MNRNISAWLALLMLYGASVCNASVFERDWKTAGDGLSTYGDVNHREWLDLTYSQISQFPEPRLQNAVAQLASGGLFDGFTWADATSVLEFAESAGINIHTHNADINYAATIHLIELLGITFQSSTTFHSIGFVNQVAFIGPGLPPQQMGAHFFTQGQGTRGTAGVSISSSDDFLRSTFLGLMLYREVPEASSCALLLLAIAFLVRKARISGSSPVF